MDVIVKWREQEVNTSKRVIWTRSMCNYKGRGIVAGHAQGNIPSTRAKNDENQRECHDLLGGMVEWSKQEVNTFKRTI
jgi:hypothetical protein